MKTLFAMLGLCYLTLSAFAQSRPNDTKKITQAKLDSLIKIKVDSTKKADSIRKAKVDSTKSGGVSLEVFTGGNLDFFNELKFQNIGGEFVLTANNIIGKDTIGKDSRLGFFLGVSNFRSFSLDSSNRNVRTQHIRTDTGNYVNGKTYYLNRVLIDHRKTTNNQWSYYINPTYRLSKEKGSLFNMYLSLRLEALRISATTSFLTDTFSTETTNRPLGNSPVFQSGKGFLLQNVTDVQTDGYFSIGTPMFLKTSDLRVYLDPNIGLATHKTITYRRNDTGNALLKEVNDNTRAFYLFRLRIIQKVSDILNITIGGEVRGILPSYDPTINAYLGVSIPLNGLLHTH